jgi:hypothetical protein
VSCFTKDMDGGDPIVNRVSPSVSLVCKHVLATIAYPSSNLSTHHYEF